MSQSKQALLPADSKHDPQEKRPLYSLFPEDYALSLLGNLFSDLLSLQKLMLKYCLMQ